MTKTEISILLFIIIVGCLFIFSTFQMIQRDTKIKRMKYTVEYKDKIYYNAKYEGNNCFLLEDGTIVNLGNNSYIRKPE